MFVCMYVWHWVRSWNLFEKNNHKRYRLLLLLSIYFNICLPWFIFQFQCNMITYNSLSFASQIHGTRPSCIQIYLFYPSTQFIFVVSIYLFPLLLHRKNWFPNRTEKLGNFQTEVKSWEIFRLSWKKMFSVRTGKNAFSQNRKKYFQTEVEIL